MASTPSVSRPPMGSIPPLPPSVVEKVKTNQATDASFAPLVDATYYRTLQTMKYAAMAMEGRDNKGDSNSSNVGVAYTPVTKKAFSASLDQQVLKELTAHVDEVLSLCSKPSALALAPSPKMAPRLGEGDGIDDIIQLPTSIATPTTTNNTNSSSSSSKHDFPQPALSELSFLCMQFQVRQESLRQQYAQGHMGTPSSTSDGGDSSTMIPPPLQVSLSDTVQGILNDIDNNKHRSSSNSGTISGDAPYVGSTTSVRPGLVPFAHLEEGHLFQVLCGMAELAFGVAIHVLRFVMRHELKTSLSQDVVFNWGVNEANQQLPNKSQCSESAELSEGDCSAANSGMQPTSSTGSGFSARTSTESLGKESMSSYEDLTKLSPDEGGSWREVCATLMYHSVNILGQVMLAQRSDTTDRERVEASLEFLTDLAGKAAQQQESGGAAPSGSSPHTAAFQHRSCLKLLHHPQMLTMRKRLQYYLLQELGGGRMPGGPSSQNTSRLIEYLSVIFNGSLLPREAELKCFAPGFKSQHMMVLANLTHNNHSASSMVATFPHASLRDGVVPAVVPSAIAATNSATITTPATPCHFNKRDESSTVRSEVEEDASPAALRPLEDDADEEGGVKVMPGMAGKHVSTTASSPQGVIDILGAVLSSTRLDTENPGLAEWSEFVLRGLCGVSMSARSRISGIQGAAKGARNTTTNTATAAAAASTPISVEKVAAPCPPSTDGMDIGTPCTKPKTPESQPPHIQALGQDTLPQEPTSIGCSEDDNDERDMANTTAADDVRVGRSESPVVHTDTAH